MPSDGESILRERRGRCGAANVKMSHKPNREKITSETQPCPRCGCPIKRKSRMEPPKKIGKGGYYFLWWFRCTNRKCHGLYMVEEAKRTVEHVFTINDIPAPIWKPESTTSASPRKLHRKEKRRKERRERKANRRNRREGRPSRYAEYVAYINSPEWRVFRLTIFALRGRRCERCGDDGSGIREVHHLTYENLGHEKPEDVQVLCVECHHLAHPKKGRRTS